MSTLDGALEALRQHFGFEDFREGQDEVIEAILTGEDALVVMPTGGGKSLCYQLPALMRDGTTVVVSPLIALMKDQVDALEARQIPVTFINSSLDYAEQTARLRAMRRGDYKLVYIAPERFRNERFVETLTAIDVSLFAVDEAHCISEWGHDFRPDYRRLGGAVERLGRPQIVALTATATPEVRADIATQLQLGDARHFIAGFDRPNLTLRVVQTSREREKVRRTARIVRESLGSGIVYAATRKAVETVANALRGEGLRARAYHAGLDDRSRSDAQDAFMNGELDAIVATNAFGMGIDKRDIRFVVHYHLPGSIEAYYQEIGRAGRDGLPATCTLLFNYADTRFQQFFIDGSFPSPEFIADVYHAVVGLGPGRHEITMRELSARANLKNEMAVGSALAVLERAGHIERGGGSDQFGNVEFGDVEAVDLESGRASVNAVRVLSALTSPHPPQPGTVRRINLSALAATEEMSVAQVRRALEQLGSRGALTYRPAYEERGILLLDERPAKALRIDRTELARRAAAEQRKLRRVVDYAYHRGCYRAYILSYFGDRRAARECGTCGNCAGEAAEALPAETARDAGQLRIRGSRAKTDLDTFILDTAPTGDALRDHLRQTNRDRTLQLEREVHTDPESLAARPAPPAELDEARTVVVRKVLSCVARAKERFGKSVIAAVLRGSKAKNVLEPGLDHLSTYGLLSDMTQDELVTWCDALVDAGLLAITPGAYPTLYLTPEGRTVMRGETAPRLDLAHYGLTASGLPRYRPEPKPRAASPLAERAAPTLDVTYALVKTGLSIDEIADRRSLSTVTVEGHIADMIAEGRIEDVSRFVTDEQFEAIAPVAREHGLERLKPIHEALGGKYRYREIRFVVAALRREK